MRAAGAAVIVATLTLIAGCSAIRSLMPAAREAQRIQTGLQELQAKCMRFADEYVGRVVEENNRFQRSLVDPDLRLVAASWALNQANSAYTTASGASPVVTALDLVTLAVLSRMVVEDTLAPQFPSETQRLLATHRQLEAQAWKLTDGFLTPSQTQDFHDILAKWRAQNPHVTNVAFVHFVDFAKAVGRPSSGEAASQGSLFAMLGLDPLAALDPAVRQIEQTRLLAERLIYYMQRVPYVLNLQVDRASSELLARPEFRGLLADTDRVSRSAERFAGVAETLPGTLAREREALITQLSGALVAQEETLRPMLVELRQALEAAGTTAASVDEVVKSVDALLARFPPAPAAAPGAAPGKPFDIAEYTRAAAEFTRTANELRQLVATLDAEAPALGRALGDTLAQGRSLVDQLFLRLALLIALLIGGTLAATLAYRVLVVRMKT